MCNVAHVYMHNHSHRDKCKQKYKVIHWLHSEFEGQPGLHRTLSNKYVRYKKDDQRIQSENICLLKVLNRMTDAPVILG